MGTYSIAQVVGEFTTAESSAGVLLTQAPLRCETISLHSSYTAQRAESELTSQRRVNSVGVDGGVGLRSDEAGQKRNGDG